MAGPPRLTFTLDLEDHRPDARYPKRFPEVTRAILATIEDCGVRGTVFVVGTLAEQEPDLVRDIAAAGHEIALHSYDHRPLPEQTPEIFRAETMRGKECLEALIGAPVVGYRAPVFSLTDATLWAPQILKELGFDYSSSVLPARNPLFGFPAAPAHPFAWPNGLLELPAPVATLGLMTVPFLGGIYLRYLPLPLIERMIRAAPEEASLWTYCHPYDFDPDEPLFRMKGANWPTSMLLWFNRRGTLRKFQRLFGGTGPTAADEPFVAQIRAGRFDDVPVYSKASPVPSAAG
ncbi:MAG: polysaccharide deacetylase family protein [Alphaproteobacteria bacterium]|nr:polysaccharide deacetylase family protein [Alphaproteobacteria bacterium]